MGMQGSDSYLTCSSTMMTLFAMMMPDDAASHAAEARISFNPLYHGSLRAIG